MGGRAPARSRWGDCCPGWRTCMITLVLGACLGTPIRMHPRINRFPLGDTGNRHERKKARKKASKKDPESPPPDIQHTHYMGLPTSPFTPTFRPEMYTERKQVCLTPTPTSRTEPPYTANTVLYVHTLRLPHPPPTLPPPRQGHKEPERCKGQERHKEGKA